MAEIPTVKVKHGTGFKIINEADFDADQHEQYSKPRRRARPKPQASEDE